MTIISRENGNEKIEMKLYKYQYKCLSEKINESSESALAESEEKIRRRRSSLKTTLNRRKLEGENSKKKKTGYICHLEEESYIEIQLNTMKGLK